MTEDNLSEDTNAAVMPTKEEKTYSEIDINNIIKREKSDAEERVRRELVARHAAEIAAIKSGQTQTMGGMKDASTPNVDEMYAQLESRFEQKMQQQQAQAQKAAHDANMKQVADNYYAKVDNARERYSDFDEIVGDFEHAAFPEVVYSLSGLENGGDILYEIVKDPRKIEQIDYWLKKSPQKGMKMLNAVGDSIKQNYNAQQSYQPTKPPLDQVRQSNLGMNNGSMSLEELHNAPWLRR